MNIWVLNTLQSGIDTIDSIHAELPITGIIGLSLLNRKDDISGYIYQRPYCEENNINFLEVDSYNLSRDKEKLSTIKIDVLLVLGWQRLIPQWLISYCNNNVIGIHGSMDGISSGRGRSPQNWALIFGKTDFSLSIFKIDSGIDSGDVIDTAVFSLTKFDDIRTSNHKVSLISASMIINALKNKKLEFNNLERQKGDFRYLPQRLPEDGYIDWNRTSDEIYNFVRALTTPYPGALSKIGKDEIKVLSAKPFYLENYQTEAQPGKIVKKFASGELLVKTKDAFLLIEDCIFTKEIDTIQVGDSFESVDFKKQLEVIKLRHYKKYPNLPLHKNFD